MCKRIRTRMQAIFPKAHHPNPFLGHCDCDRTERQTKDSIHGKSDDTPLPISLTRACLHFQPMPGQRARIAYLVLIGNFNLRIPASRNALPYITATGVKSAPVRMGRPSGSSGAHFTRSNTPTYLDRSCIPCQCPSNGGGDTHGGLAHTGRCGLLHFDTWSMQRTDQERRVRVCFCSAGVLCEPCTHMHGTAKSWHHFMCLTMPLHALSNA